MISLIVFWDFFQSISPERGVLIYFCLASKHGHLFSQIANNKKWKPDSKLKFLWRISVTCDNQCVESCEKHPMKRDEWYIRRKTLSLVFSTMTNTFTEDNTKRTILILTQEWHWTVFVMIAMFYDAAMMWMPISHINLKYLTSHVNVFIKF